MGGSDILCAPQSSTSICLTLSSSMDDIITSSSSSSTIVPGGRAIDRHNPIITDSRRAAITRTLSTPSSSKSPINYPKPYQNQHQKTKTKSSSSSKRNDKKNKSSSKENDYRKKEIEESTENLVHCYSLKPVDSILKRNYWVKPSDFDNIITSTVSSRYLLSDAEFPDGITAADLEPVQGIAPFDRNKVQSSHADELCSAASNPSGSSQSQRKSSAADQVVILKVSLHCKGCAGKLKKHLSRMEGVTSFNIDFGAKKVTIVGNVTPLSVLSSVSKVKNAQFWPVSASTPGSTTETNNN